MTAQDLQTHTALLSKAASFMITTTSILFRVPPRLIDAVRIFQDRRNSEGRINLVKKTSRGELGVAFLIAGAAFSFDSQGELRGKCKLSEYTGEEKGRKEKTKSQNGCRQDSKLNVDYNAGKSCQVNQRIQMFEARIQRQADRDRKALEWESVRLKSCNVEKQEIATLKETL